MRQCETETTQDVVILVRDGDGWRQYFVVSDARVAIVHMTPALFGGWRLDRVNVQGSEDWPNMSRDLIVAWKFRADDGRTRIADDLGAFRDKLIDHANGHTNGHADGSR